MNNEKTWLSCSEAAVLLNCSHRNISNLIKKGKLSAGRDETGKWIIDKSEFFRAYPDAMSMETPGTGEKNTGDQTMKVLEEKIKHLQDMVDEKKKQNEFLLSQLSVNTEEKSKMLDAINSHTRLLEYKETASSPNNPSQERYSDRKGLSLGWKWPFKSR